MKGTQDLMLMLQGSVPELAEIREINGSCTGPAEALQKSDPLLRINYKQSAFR